MSIPSTDKPTVVRPPIKQSSIPIPQEDRIDEAPPGASARMSIKSKSVCPDCRIEEMPSGEGIARIIIPPDVLRRLKTRAQGLTLDEYVWSMVVRPALYAHVY